jgi:hypothetical protein
MGEDFFRGDLADEAAGEFARLAGIRLIGAELGSFEREAFTSANSASVKPC